MEFNQFRGIRNTKGKEVIKRISVRTVIRNENQFLMLSTKRGDLIFPGGGIELDETQEEAASRELLEETGYKAKGEMKYLGKFVTRRIDRFNDHYIYEAEMYFYLCDVYNEPFDTTLSENEIDLKIKPLWLRKSEIIEINRKYNDTLVDSDVWTEMTKFVLEYTDTEG